MTHRAHPAIALCVYAEELVVGSRAAIFGASDMGLAEALIRRGARLVHVYDADAARVAEATAARRQRGVFFAPLTESGDVGVRDGAFDVVFVPDLSQADDPRALLGLVRRVLSPQGAALIASPNTEAKSPLIFVSQGRTALGYYELYEAVAEHFADVRMIGQAPFVGYAVAELSAEDPEPVIDSSLTEHEDKEPDWFWVLASERGTRLEAFSLIELPPDAVLYEEEEHPPALPVVREEAVALTDIVEAERAAALESLDEQQKVAKEERQRADTAVRELAAAREELALVRARCESLERALEQEEARRAAAEANEEQLRRSKEELTARERSIEAGRKASDEEHERDVARFESQLQERGSQIQELSAEVARREELVREILASLPGAASLEPPSKSNGEVADLSARLDRLAAEAARREADLVASHWKIAQLKRELAQRR